MLFWHLFFYLYYMMKNKLYFLLLLFLSGQNFSVAQGTAAELHKNAKIFMKQQDYANAVLLLVRAEKLAPNDIEIRKDLALNYFYQTENDKALDAIRPALDWENTDDQCYQIAGYIYQALRLPKDCEKLYKKGLKKFPASGPLHNDYGLLLIAEQNTFLAIDQWEKGIQTDPAYPDNYYNACKFYYLSEDYVWCLLYGEIFLNEDPFSTKTAEVKDLLIDTYKKLYAVNDFSKLSKGKNKFATSVLDCFAKQNNIVSNGINAETITMIRTRFILDWIQNYATQYPFHLFEREQELIQNGLFDAYNQWIFGAAQNPAAYQNWTNLHVNEYSAFSRDQHENIFKMPSGQYYK